MKEAEFSRSLSGILKKSGFVVTRIESHGTGNGIPDMFVQGHGSDFWLELKSVKAFGNKVDWRPGQQAWMLDYYIRHNKLKCCLTLVKTDHGDVYIIRMTRAFSNNRVYNVSYVQKDYVKYLPIILYVMSHNLDMHGCETYRDAIIRFCECYFPSKDYDPEVLWDETIDQELDPEVFYNNQIDLYLDMID